MDKIFDKKRRIIDYNGEEYINMCIPTVNISKIVGNDVVKVGHDDNGRIDTFTWCNVAHDMDMIDNLMYANHIFNPFAIKEEDVLYIPVDMENVYMSTDEPSLPDGTKHSNNIKGEKEMSYAEKIEFLARQGLGIK